MPIKQKITPRISPCLWFDTQAEEAANFYAAIFDDSRITKISRYTKAGRDIHGKEAGSVLTVEFELEGQTFTALNGGSHFKFNEAVSFQVMCAGQAVTAAKKASAAGSRINSASLGRWCRRFCRKC